MLAWKPLQRELEEIVAVIAKLAVGGGRSREKVAVIAKLAVGGGRSREKVAVIAKLAESAVGRGKQSL